MDIQVAPEVAEIVPQEMLERWRSDPGYEHVDCKACTLRITGSAALVVLRDPVLGAMYLVATHPGCLPSAVLEADLRDLVLPEDGFDVRITAGQSLGSAGLMASLLVETRVTVALPAGDDAQDLLTATALSLGLHLISVLSVPPPAPSRPGWEVVLTPQETGGYAMRIETPDGGEFAQGEFQAPGPAWEAQIRRDGVLTLLVGTTMLSNDELPAAQSGLVEHLAGRGRLAGAAVPARFAG